MEQPNQSKLECYLKLKRNYELAEYRYTVKDTKQRQIFTKYRLSDHSLAIETGRYNKSWLPRDQRICGHCMTAEVETEMHFLHHCNKFKKERTKFFKKLSTIISDFDSLNSSDKMSITLGEGQTAPLAAQFIKACQDAKDRV